MLTDLVPISFDNVIVTLVDGSPRFPNGEANVTVVRPETETPVISKSSV